MGQDEPYQTPVLIVRSGLMKSPPPLPPRDISDRKPTINDVARLANVSKKTVSRVINDGPFVHKDTRDRVQKVIDETGYVPDPQARGLAFRRSFLIGLIYENPNAQYVVNIQMGILDALRGSGFELVVHPCDRTSPTFLADVRAFIERQKLYGVVMVPPTSEEDRVAVLMEQIGCEYVRIASVDLDTPEHMLVSHDRLGGEAAARHLAALGHKEVGFISGPNDFRSSHERRAGFVTGLAEHGLSLPPRLIHEGAYTFESGLAGGEALLALRPRPTAIFAANDEMAAGLLQAARNHSLRVPEELSIVGYDDFKIAMVVYPQLTTIRSPSRMIAQIAGEMLLGRKAEDAAGDDLRPSLVVRGSTAPPPRGRA
ncbi:MAG: transcriptional regulator, LacI family [Caulobacteraceae bacterium]|nr:transcriptional regulator, LacI family [Caulobacteraceae bacterium]